MSEAESLPDGAASEQRPSTADALGKRPISAGRWS